MSGNLAQLALLVASRVNRKMGKEREEKPREREKRKGKRRARLQAKTKAIARGVWGQGVATGPGSLAGTQTLPNPPGPRQEPELPN